MSDQMKEKFPLVDVINALRQDLSKAMDDGGGEVIRFNMSEIEVELQTVLEANDSMDAGFNISVLKFGTDLSDKNMQSQTVKFKLKPKILNKNTGEYVNPLIADEDD